MAKKKLYITPEEDWDNIVECKKCDGYYDKGDVCRTCYFNEAPLDTWIKVTKNLDLPSFQDVLIFTPDHNTSILMVSLCDSDRRNCKKWHITGVDSCGMGDPKFMELPFKSAKFWRKLPMEPKV